MNRKNLFHVLFALILFAWFYPVSADNILVNGDLENLTPNFWSATGADQTGVTCEWAWEGAGGSQHSLKVVKTQATASEAGWVSANNAHLYWNAAKANLLYNLSFQAKTEGVNTNPSSNDARIGVLFSFYHGGVLLAEKLVPVDQSAGSITWTDYTDGLLVPAGDDPDEMVMKVIAGKNATGTVWVDNIGCGADPWCMWPFNGDIETPVGWMNWAAGMVWDLPIWTAPRQQAAVGRRC